MPQQQQQDDKQQQSPDNLVNLSFEQFQGINTATTRPGVDDKQAYWLDGFMPLAPGNLRTLYGVGSPLYTMPVREATSLAILAAGSGGSGGPFAGIAFSGGSGTGAVATVTLTGGSVSAVTVTNPGENYSVGNILVPSASIGGVTGFSVSVASIINPTMSFFNFFNIGATPYAVVFSSDGSAVQVNTSNASVTTILPYGTILLPTVTTVGTTQYGSQYLIIVANQPNGYFVWDGSLLYQAGSLAPGVSLINVGSGYSSVPIVTATGGLGLGALFSATINSSGNVDNVSIINPGRDYLATDSVALVFTGGNSSGSGGSLSAVLSDKVGGAGASLSAIMGTRPFYYTIGSIAIVSAGSGYNEQTTTLNISGGSPAGGSSPATATITITNGEVSSVTVTQGGYYLTANPPTVTVTDPGFFYVSSVAIIDAGHNYGPNISISVVGGGSPQTQAVLNAILDNGSIVEVDISNSGVYATNTVPTVTVSDSAETAAATVTLMPYGISGTAAQTYQGHVWVFNGSVFNFTAPGSVSNFATSAGGGSQQSNSSYLKVGYTYAVSTNGFLFLIGDSSMDYISGVQTSGTVPTTTFTQNNCDPEVGSPYPAAITTLGQEIMMANSTGVFVSSGGTFIKRSEPLDGVFNTVPGDNFNLNPFDGFQLSVAKATIFGKRIWIVLVPIVDPVSGEQVNKLIMYNGNSWWASEQDVDLTFINGQEINSVYRAWGTDGTSLYPLFQSPSTDFTKVAQSKLWFDPGGYEGYKTVNRFWSVWECYSTISTAIIADIDGTGLDADGNQFSNTNSYTITGPVNMGFFITPPQAVGQQGVATGMTIVTEAADMALISAKISSEYQGYRG